jgi:hypothetical protein
MVKDIVLSVLLPVVVQKLQCSARCVVELALICEFGTYHEVVGIILEGSRSEFATLIGVGPGLCGLPRILFPRLYEKSSQGVNRLVMRRIMAAYTNASPLAHRNLS